MPEKAEGQSSSSVGSLPMIESGVFKPTPPKAGSQEGHSSRHYLTGLLKAGNIRLEMHESTIQAAPRMSRLGRICIARYGWCVKARLS